MTYSKSVLDLPPALLFKYRRFDRGHVSGAEYEWDQDAIVRDRLWAGSPTAFNDPFDCVPSIDLRGSPDEARQFARRMANRRALGLARSERRRELARNTKALKHGFRVTQQQGLEAWTTMLPRLGVLSLAERPDDMLMWGYYADSHRGYCMSLRTRAAPLIHAHRVKYGEKRPVFRPMDPDRSDLMERTLLQKADFWAHEREWRVITRYVGTMPISVDDLEGVILGAAIAPEDEEALRTMISQRKVRPKMQRAVLDRTTYRLSLAPA